jgi:hypothetical protein
MYFNHRHYGGDFFCNEFYLMINEEIDNIKGIFFEILLKTKQ